MARFLLVVPPMTGHTLPMTAIARALEGRGHRTAWVASEDHVGHLLPPDAVLCPSPVPYGKASVEEYRTVRGLAAVRALVEDILVPTARAMVPEVEAAVERFEPDLLVTEQLAWGGSLGARRAGQPWASVAANFGTRRFAVKDIAPILAWSDEWWGRLQRELGLPEVEEPESSPLLNLVLTSRRFVGADGAFPSTFHFVGPVTARDPDPTPFPWDELEPGSTVLVSLGSVESVRGGRFYDAVAEGLAALEANVVVVSPPEFGPFPDRFIVRPWVPQLALLEKVDAVVSHGGMNTVHEALAYGVPLVVAPVVNDQSWIASRVVEAGAGLRVSFGRPRPDELREAVERVLAEPSFREGARAVATSFVEAGGAERAAILLEDALTRPGPG